jgi:hypothetical protein
MRVLRFLLALVVGALIAQPMVHADVGVGVSLGNVKVDDALSPGGRYRLPTLSVLNTGDEPSQYEVVSASPPIAESRPPNEWLTFAAAISLEPNHRAVAITPRADERQPGDYLPS